MPDSERWTKREVVMVASLAIIVTAIPWGLLMVFLYYALSPWAEPL